MEDFDEWHCLKKKTHKKIFEYSESNPYPKAGEVWMFLLGKNIGREQNGGGDNFSRPVLVLRKINNEIFIVAPMSTKQKVIDYYYNLTDPNGLEVSIIVAQLRLVSVNRFKRKLYELDNEVFGKVKSTARRLFI